MSDYEIEKTLNGLKEKMKCNTNCREKIMGRVNSELRKFSSEIIVMSINGVVSWFRNKNMCSITQFDIGVIYFKGFSDDGVAK